MDTIWTTLGIEPTKDVSAIKRAYAEKAKTCHPEEDPEGFLQLRQAYQAALAWAENGETPPAAGPEAFSPERTEPEDEGWSLSEKPALWDEGPNPFAEHPAAVAFRELYTGRRRKDPKAWMEFRRRQLLADRLDREYHKQIRLRGGAEGTELRGPAEHQRAGHG